MSFLDQLEQEARRQREEEEEKALAREEREVFFREIAEPTIRQLFEYLKKLADHINYLGQKHEIVYSAPGYQKITGNLKELRVRFSAAEESRQIDIVGTAEIPRQRQVNMVGDVEVNRMRTFLRDRGLQGAERLQRSEKGGIVSGSFRVSGQVQLRALIQSSIDDPEIRMEFTNLHDFGKMVRVVPPEHMDDDLMDKVGRFIARVDDSLLREDLSDDIREKLRERLRTDRRRTVEEINASDYEREKDANAEQDRIDHAENLAGRFRSRLEEAKKKLSDE